MTEKEQVQTLTEYLIEFLPTIGISADWLKDTYPTTHLKCDGRCGSEEKGICIACPLKNAQLSIFPE